MNYIYEQLAALTAIPSPSGLTRDAAVYTMQQFQKLGYEASLTRKGCVLVDLGGEGEGLMLSAHIDTLGCMVAEVKANGALRLTNIGSMNAISAESENVIIVTRDGRTFSGVCQLVNASCHVNIMYNDIKRDYSNVEVLVDEKVYSKQDTERLGIGAGDYVCIEPKTVITQSGYIKSRFLDDKLFVAMLLGYAKRLKELGAKLNRHVYCFISAYEEIGHGARASIPSDVTDIISIDMGCIGDGLQCRETQCSICAKNSAGPSDFYLTNELIECAKENGIDYVLDVYPYYSSDGDAALGAGYDVRHCVVGAGVYASHGYERAHKDGVLNTLNLLLAYTTVK